MIFLAKVMDESSFFGEVVTLGESFYLLIVSKRDGHGVGAEATVEVDLCFFAQALVDIGGDRLWEKRACRWNCSCDAASPLEDFFLICESDCLGADELLESFGVETFVCRHDCKVERGSFLCKLLSTVFEEHGLGSAGKRDSPNVGCLLRCLDWLMLQVQNMSENELHKLYLQ